MKFLLKFDRGDGLIFDNENHTLITKDGTPVISQTPVESNWNLFKVHPDTPVRKTSDVRVLKIQLGLNCNYSCGYCLQAAHVNQAVITNTTDVDTFLEAIDANLTGAPETVQLWGGEPLVYWKKLQKLIPALRERFPEATMSFLTNGALLRDEVADFAIKYNVSVGMSHDGTAQQFRDKEDPLKDPVVISALKKLADHYGAVGVNSVITEQNPNPIETLKWFKENYPFLTVGFEGVVASHDGKTFQFSEENFDILHDGIMSAVKDGTIWDYGPYFYDRVNHIMADFLAAKDVTTQWQKCGMDKPDTLTLDLKGNALTCQNVGATPDHVYGNFFSDESVSIGTGWHWSYRRECPTCPVLSVCGGSCMKLPPDSKEWNASCENDFKFSLALFAAALWQFTGRELLEIQSEQKVVRPQMIPAISIG